MHVNVCTVPNVFVCDCKQEPRSSCVAYHVHDGSSFSCARFVVQHWYAPNLPQFWLLSWEGSLSKLVLQYHRHVTIVFCSFIGLLMWMGWRRIHIFCQMIRIYSQTIRK